jgi:hypothetical protein
MFMTSGKLSAALYLFFLVLVLPAQPVRADDCSAKVDPVIREMVNEVNAEGAEFEAAACGMDLSIEAEIGKIFADGTKESTNCPSNLSRSWGCNYNPSSFGNQSIVNKLKPLSETEGTASITIAVRVTGLWNRDPEEATKLSGTIKDQRNKPLKGVKVTAKEVRRDITKNTETDDSGHYELKLPSGQYRVSGQKDNCSGPPKIKKVCGWGPAGTGPVRKAEFEQDMQLTCNLYSLSVNGSYEFNLAMNEADAQMTGQTPYSAQGRFDIFVDGQTGQLTGGGAIVGTTSGGQASGNFSDATASGSGSATPSTIQYKVTGVVRDETASVRLDCVQMGGQSAMASATMTFADGDVMTGSGQGSAGAQACPGYYGPIQFSIPWSAGGAQHFDRTLSWDIEGMQASMHEMYDFTVEEKK